MSSAEVLAVMAVILLLATAAAQGANAGVWPLTEEGRPAATIVIAPEATRSAQLGAYELQQHLEKISGAKLPIVRDVAQAQGTRLLVGESPATRALGLRNEAFGEQEYLIRFLPGTIVLMGRDAPDTGEVDADPDNPFRFSTFPDPLDDCATLYAVSDFLRDYCEVRWFTPTELGTVYPRRRTVTITEGRDVRRAPAYKTRNFGAYYHSASPPGWTVMTEHLDYQAMLWRPDTPQAAEVERLSWPELQRRYPDWWQYVHAKRTEGLLWMYRTKLGGRKYFANHSLYGYYRRFGENPEDEAFEQHRPEFFAQGYEGQPPQPCFSNEGLLQQVIQDARDYFDGRGSKVNSQNWGDYFAVVPEDNSSWCRCPECAPQIRERPTTGFSNDTGSDYVFGFVNRVARALQEDYPDKYVAALAYACYAGQPVFPLEPNVSVDMCLHTRGWWAPANRRMDMWMIDEWRSEKDKRPLYAWVYWTFPLEIANNGKWHAFPGFFAHTAAEQFRIMHEAGIEGIFYCGIGQDVENYVAVRMMDDPSLDVGELLDEYFNMLYGNAGPILRELYEAIEETYMNPANYPAEIISGEVGGHQTRDLAWKWLGTHERMASFGQLMEQAKAVRVTSAQRARLELFEKAVWEYMVAGRELEDMRDALPTPQVTVPRVPSAQGDPSQADWSQAPELGRFYERGTDELSARRLAAAVVHDGEYLYLRLEDPCETQRLVTAPGVAPYDDWEIFTAQQRGVPYRQFMVAPSGRLVALTHGEVNYRMNVALTEHGVRTVSDTEAPDRWVTYLAIPLDQVVADRLEPGDEFFLSVIRVSGPALTGRGLVVDCSLTFANVHEPARMAELTLAP